MDEAGVESDMGIREGLPHRLLTQREVMTLSQEAADIEEVLAVFAFDGGSVLEHYVAVFYLQTQSRRALCGYDAAAGWMIIERVPSGDQFEHGETSLRAWMDDHESKTWYVEQGGPSHASPFTFATNVDGAPAFLTDDR
jgi:hypothetical protein